MRLLPLLLILPPCTTVIALTDRHATERVYYDGIDEWGNLAGGFTEAQLQPTDLLLRSGFKGVTTILDSGPTGNRIDVVFVGDGYLESELDTYSDHVDSVVGAFFSQEPFASYIGMFNMYRVDVVSNESGVDNDSNEDDEIDRDTAMDMAFWCDGTERLLCVDTCKAYGFANNAFDVDHVFAVANSTKYGGAGYTSSDLATYSGGSKDAPELALHEWGHSMGNLADEYFEIGSGEYPDDEPTQRNASTYIEPHTKWASWIGYNNLDWGGLIGTYLGCHYYESGIYRPTVDSKMRTLNQPFNLPSVEGFLIEIYKIVDPIDASTPSSLALSGMETVVVELITTGGEFEFTIVWYLDGVVVPGESAGTLDLAQLDLAYGTHTLDVVVVDNTEWVRDEVARSAWMTDMRSWSIEVEVGCSGDVDRSGAVDVLDLLDVLKNWGPCNGCVEDVNGDGWVADTDVLWILTVWGACP